MAVFGGNLKKQIFNLLAVQGFGILLPTTMVVDPAKLEKPHPHTSHQQNMCNLKLEKIRYTVTGALQNFHGTWEGFIELAKRLDGLPLE